MKIAIITGPRTVTAQDEQLVRAVVRELIARGFTLYVGDAAGVDAVAADEAYPRGFQQFFPRPDLGRTPAGLAERSTRMVKAALRAAQSDEIICVGFPDKPCPSEIVPARSWKSGGSGTWSTLALTVGHEIETWTFPIGEHVLTIREPYWIGTLGMFDRWHGWHFTPEPTLFPESAHDALCRGWTELSNDALAETDDEN